MNLWDTRTEYDRPSLDDTHTPERPHQLFEQWMQAALDAQLPEANAMTLSTLNTSGFPTARIVLLRAQHEDRFTFFTNYHSNKGKELAQNPQCSALFFWPSLERQIRISGVCTPVSESESDHYFASRPYGSQIGAWASDQSHPITSRAILMERVAYFEKKFPESEKVPRPPYWGGYVLCACDYEFWQGQPNRLHDRVYYQRAQEQHDEWQRTRLSP